MNHLVAHLVPLLRECPATDDEHGIPKRYFWMHHHIRRYAQLKRFGDSAVNRTLAKMFELACSLTCTVESICIELSDDKEFVCFLRDHCSGSKETLHRRLLTSGMLIGANIPLYRSDEWYALLMFMYEVRKSDAFKAFCSPGAEQPSMLFSTVCSKGLISCTGQPFASELTGWAQCQLLARLFTEYDTTNPDEFCLREHRISTNGTYFHRTAIFPGKGMPTYGLQTIYNGIHLVRKMWDRHSAFHGRTQEFAFFEGTEIIEEKWGRTTYFYVNTLTDTERAPEGVPPLQDVPLHLWGNGTVWLRQFYGQSKELEASYHLLGWFYVGNHPWSGTRVDTDATGVVVRVQHSDARLFAMYNDALDTFAPDHRFLCPITKQLMVDPVVASDGVTYERSAITRVILQDGGISPMTRQELTPDVHRNLFAKDFIDSYVKDALEAALKFYRLSTDLAWEDVEPLISAVDEVCEKYGHGAFQRGFAALPLKRPLVSKETYDRWLHLLREYAHYGESGISRFWLDVWMLSKRHEAERHERHESPKAEGSENTGRILRDRRVINYKE